MKAMFDFKKLRKGNYIMHTEGPYEFMGERLTIIEDAKMEYVQLSNSRELTITYPTTNGNETIMAKHADPIPLSIDWLLRFGFKEGKFSIIQAGVSIEKIHYEKGFHCVHVLEDGYRLMANGEGPVVPLQHVHELQNMWQHCGLGSLAVE